MTIRIGLRVAVRVPSSESTLVALLGTPKKAANNGIFPDRAITGGAPTNRCTHQNQHNAVGESLLKYAAGLVTTDNSWGGGKLLEQQTMRAGIRRRQDEQRHQLSRNVQL